MARDVTEVFTIVGLQVWNTAKQDESLSEVKDEKRHKERDGCIGTPT